MHASYASSLPFCLSLAFSLTLTASHCLSLPLIAFPASRCLASPHSSSLLCSYD
jgi:hypothetical protein